MYWDFVFSIGQILDQYEPCVLFVGAPVQQPEAGDGLQLCTSCGPGLSAH